MHALWLFFALFLLSTSSVEALEIKNISEAINIAGKQRMLKDYAMLGMHNRFGDPKADLEKIMHDFEEHMYALSNFTEDADTKRSISEAEKLWHNIKPILTEKPTPENAKILQPKLEELLKEADKTTRLFAAQSQKKTGEIINISGRQRMLSQKMANLYMLKAWGIDNPTFEIKRVKR